MTSLNRFRSGTSRIGTKNIDRLLNDAITFQAKAKFDREATNTIANYTPYATPYTEVDANRSVVDRGFDLLLGANYAVAGAFDGLVRDDKSILEGFTGGLKAANPFGAGYKSGETTFSDVIRSGLERSGLDAPKNIFSKAVVGTTGFVLDVLLDPTTYLTFGASALVKGTGKVGKAAQTIETLAKNNPDFATGLREAGGLTDELAEQIVMKANGITSFDEIASSSKAFAEGSEVGAKIGADQFKQEVAELKRTYNSLLGVERTGVGITLGIQNAPFGETIARKLGITKAPITIANPAPLRAFSDATGISTAYSASREIFYGSKLGSLLSRNAGLKRLADADPAKVYEYVGAINKLRGRDLDKLARSQEIRKIGEQLLDLTPAEQSKIIKALEDPSLFSKAKDILKGSGTNTWLKLEGEYKQTAENLRSSIAEAKRISADIETANLNELTKYREEVAQLNTYKNNTAQQTSILKALDDEIGKLIVKKSDVESSQKVKDYDSIIKSLDSEIASRQVARTTLETNLTAEGAQYAPYKALDNAQLNSVIDEALGRVASTEAYAKSISEATASNRITKVLDRQSETTALRTSISHLLFGEPNAIPPNVGYDKLKSIADALKRSDNPDASFGALLGDTGGYNFASFAKGKRELYSIVKSGTDPFDVVQKVLKSETLVGGSDSIIYGYLANKYGYGNVGEVRDRIKNIDKQLDELRTNPNGGIAGDAVEGQSYLLVKALNQESTTLKRILLDRQRELDEIFKIPNPRDRVRFVEALKDAETERTMNEVLFGNIDAAKLRDDIIFGQSDYTETVKINGVDTKIFKTNEYSGTKYDGKLNIEDQTFAQEARTWGSTPTDNSAEVRHMRETQSDTPYTREQINEHSSDAIKSTIIENRTKAIMSQGLSPQAKELLSELNSKATEINTLRALIKDVTNNGSLTIESARNFKAENAKLLDEYRVIKERAERTTNLLTKRKEADNLSPEDLKLLGAQLNASLQIQHAIFPRHRFTDLTTAQKNMITNSSFYATKSFTKHFGPPNKKTLDRFVKWVEDKSISEIRKKSGEFNTKRSEQLQVSSLLEKVTYESGVEFKQGDEVLRGTVQGIKEETVSKIRDELDIQYTSLPPEVRLVNSQRPVKRNGKPVLNADGSPKMKNRQVIEQVPREPQRVETIKKVPYEEKTGSYIYDILTPDGKLVSVKSSDIVGTFDDSITSINHRIPEFVQKELDRIDSDIIGLKNRLRGTKSAKTKQDKALASRISEIDEQLGELFERKSREEGLLNTYKALTDEYSANLLKAFPGETTSITPTGVKTASPNGQIITEESLVANQQKVLNDFEQSIAKMAEREAQITKALDDNDAFEMLIKLDLGEDGYAKLYNSSSQKVDSATDLVIDRLTDWDKNIIDMTKLVRDNFKRAGLDEVAVGKLDEGAFKELTERYFPRTLSDDGKKFFDDNPELAQKYSAVSNQYGFGRKFNQYTLSRSDELRDKTITQVNDFFQSEVGVRIFEENLGKAFINRMVVSNEMVYDQRALQMLTHNFGHPTITTRKGKNNFKEGYNRVINYGTLKQVVRDKVLSQYRVDYKGIKHTKEEFDEITQGLANDLLGRAGLDPKLLDGETTPLIKLEDNQVQRVGRVLGIRNIRQINQLTVERANQVRQLTLERDSNRMVQLYDKFLTFFKLNQTTVMPSFHTRNHIGSMFVGWLHAGNDALSIAKQKEAYSALKAYGNGKTLRELPRITAPDGRSYDYEELLDLAQNYNVLDNGLLAKDFTAASFSQGTRVIPGKFDPFNTTEFLPYKIGSKIATFSDNINRLTQFSSLIKQGKTPAEAGAQTTKYLFDYSDVTPFEARWMKRILPYYTFMRKNLPLMANEFLENPEKLQFIAKLGNLPEGAVNPEDRVDDQFKTGFAQDYIQLPFNIGGGDNAKPALFNPTLPIQQLRDINTDGDLGDQTRTLFSQSSPLLKVPFELATNWNSFFDDEIVQEGDNVISPRVTHALGQLAGFNAVKQFVTASNNDTRLLSLLNSTTGVRISAYDEERAKEKVYEDAYNKEFRLTVQNLIGTGVKYGTGFVDNVHTDVSDFVVKLSGEPYKAVDAVGVLAPISGKTYEEIPDDEKKFYTFDSKTQSYVNDRAIEFEREQYNKTGVLKKFAWMLIKDDGFDTTTVRVERVKDGDTFVANQNGKNFDVRLYLVDTPESAGDYKDNPQPFGVEASNRTKDLVLGKDVKLYLDGSTSYGRRLAFVEYGGVSLQETLVEEGLGKVRQYDQNYTDKAEQLYNLEEEAYKAKRGIFSKEGYAIPRSNTGFQ